MTIAVDLGRKATKQTKQTKSFYNSKIGVDRNGADRLYYICMGVSFQDYGSFS